MGKKKSGGKADNLTKRVRKAVKHMKQLDKLFKGVKEEVLLEAFETKDLTAVAKALGKSKKELEKEIKSLVSELSSVVQIPALIIKRFEGFTGKSGG